MTTIPFLWIQSNQELQTASQHWLQCSVVFVDTEFVRRSTFFPQLGLIQLSDGDTHWLIDPSHISDWQPFTKVLASDSVLKVMHSASEDIDVFWSSFNCIPKPLFDTQIATGLAGIGAGFGFAKMVEHFTGSAVDKTETTSDWLARPLTEKQCQYAVADVALLAPCFERLQETLVSQQRFDWVLEDSQRLIDSHVCFMPPQDMYLRVKGVGKLGRAKLAVAQDIACWREAQVRELDRPRSRVLHDADLVAIAKRSPTHINEIPRSDAIGAGWLRKFGSVVIDVINQSLERDTQSWPELVKEPSAAEKAHLKASREYIQQLAEQIDIDANVIASKKDLRALYAAITQELPLPPLYQGWRANYLEALLKNEPALS